MLFANIAVWENGKCPTDFSDGVLPAGVVAAGGLPANHNTYEVSSTSVACKNLQFVRFMYHRISYPLQLIII